MLKVVVLLSTLAVLASGQNEINQAGQQFNAAFQSLGQYFVRQYKTVQDFFAGTKTELEKKVGDTAQFLDDAKTNMNNLMADAQKKGDAKLQEALQKVNGFSQDVNNFQTKVKSSADAQYQELSNEWKTKANSMYQGGLDTIIQAAQAAKTAGSSRIQAGGLVLSSIFGLIMMKLLQ